VKLASQILRVLESGPRKANVLRGLAASQAQFERAIGVLFLLGVVRWEGRKRRRLLARAKVASARGAGSP